MGRLDAQVSAAASQQTRLVLVYRHQLPLSATACFVAIPTHTPSQRYWIQFFVVLILGLFVSGLVLAIDTAYLDLVLLWIYCIPSNSVFPIPHEPGILHVASSYPPIMIAIAATAGSGIACLSDYALVLGAMRHRRVQRIQSSRWFRTAVRFFLKFPFLTVTIFAFTPLPISVVRVLAPASGYSVTRYLFAQLLGRFPRFYLLACLGTLLSIPTWIVLLAVAGPLVMVILGGCDRTNSSQTESLTSSPTHGETSEN